MNGWFLGSALLVIVLDSGTSGTNKIFFLLDFCRYVLLHSSCSEEKTDCKSLSEDPVLLSWAWRVQPEDWCEYPEGEGKEHVTGTSHPDLGHRYRIYSITCSEDVFLPSSSLLAWCSRKLPVGESNTVLYGGFGRWVSQKLQFLKEDQTPSAFFVENHECIIVSARIKFTFATIKYVPCLSSVFETSFSGFFDAGSSKYFVHRSRMETYVGSGILELERGLGFRVRMTV